MPYTIVVTRVDPEPTAAFRAKVAPANLASQIPKLFDEVYAFLRASSVQHLGLNVMLYEPEDSKVEAAVKVTEPFLSTGNVICSSTPGGNVATTTHIGEYSELSAAHKAIRTWCEESGIELSGRSWEAYGHWNDDPTLRTTQVYYLMKE
jgi:effector-binding domain-containing protein